MLEQSKHYLGICFHMDKNNNSSLNVNLKENDKVKLNCLSNAELTNRLEFLVSTEKETTTEIIRHLAEIENRRLYASLGFGSLFDYAVRKLGYSNAAAMRRINVARAGTKLPKLFDYLDNETVTLSSLDACRELLLGENGAEILDKLQGKSREQAEWLSASYQPVKKNKDHVEKIFIGEAPSFQKGLFENEINFRSGSRIPNHFEREESQEKKSVTEEKYKISFTTSVEFMEKVKRAQEILFTGRSGDLPLEKVFAEGLDLFIEKYCPKERQKRREVRELKKESVVVNQPTIESKELSNSRYIPVWLRDEVLKRDGYRCSYVSAQGYRCDCPVGLEIDHVIPFSKGGKTDLENLRILCSTHNFLAEIEVFGSAFVEEKIERARSKL